jgi:hypothetical protein
MPKELHCPVDEETDQAIESRIAILKIGKGDWFRGIVEQALRGKANVQGKDPVTRVLLKVDAAKFELKTVQKEIRQAGEEIRGMDELKEFVQKLPAFIEMRQNGDQLLKNLANNSALTKEEKSQFKDGLSELSNRFNEFFLTVAKLLYNHGFHELGDGIYSYESRFISMETWNLLEEYLDVQGDGDYACDAAKEAIIEWIRKDYLKRDAERLRYNSHHLFENETSRQNFESNFPNLRSETMLKTEKTQDTTKPEGTKLQDTGKPESTTTKPEDTKELETPGGLSFYRQAKQGETTEHDKE